MPYHRKRKADCKVSLDIISDLPRNVIDCILERLPIRDAARTSILSRKWRNYWITHPQLVFDEQFYEDVLKDRLSVTYEFVRIVSKVLLLHTGPILQFLLYIPNLNFTSSPDINEWIHFLSRNGIKEFTLENSYHVPHKLPSYLFSCLELTHLKLCNCVFSHPPASSCFRNLISLEFHEIKFVADTFGILISSCPLLERLTLDSCTGLAHLDIHAHNLKHLFVWAGRELKSICLKNAQNLTTVSITLYDMMRNLGRTKTSNMIKVLGCLPRVEKLCLGDFFCKFLAAGGVPKRLPTIFNYLKNLEGHIDFNDFGEISCALCLVRSSPNLQELEISALQSTTAVMERVLNFLEPQDYSDCNLGSLRIVKFRFIMGLRPELDLIKFLLACSPVLETMFIECSEVIDEDAEFSMSKELMRFRRASPKAEIIYLDPSEDQLAE